MVIFRGVAGAEPLNNFVPLTHSMFLFYSFPISSYFLYSFFYPFLWREQKNTFKGSPWGPGKIQKKGGQIKLR